MQGVRTGWADTRVGQSTCSARVAKGSESSYAIGATADVSNSRRPAATAPTRSDGDQRRVHIGQSAGPGAPAARWGQERSDPYLRSLRDELVDSVIVTRPPVRKSPCG